MAMCAAFNAKERSVSEWKALLQEADPRFVVRNAVLPKGSAMGMLEIVWTVEDE